VVHLLIIDENIDFAKSLGNIITETLGKEAVQIEYAFNGENGIQLGGQYEFNYIIIGLNFILNSVDKVKAVLSKSSFYPSTRIIVASFNNSSRYKTLIKEAGASHYLVKDEISFEKIKEIFDLERNE